jgi:hypothetical protein
MLLLPGRFGHQDPGVTCIEPQDRSSAILPSPATHGPNACCLRIELILTDSPGQGDNELHDGSTPDPGLPEGDVRILLKMLVLSGAVCTASAVNNPETSQPRQSGNRSESRPAIDSGPRDLTPDLVTCFGYSFARQKTEHFQLFYRDRSSSIRIVYESCDFLEKVYREFYADFSTAGFNLRAVAEPLPWIVFDSRQPYREFARIADGMQSPSLESYYSVRNNQVVLMQTAANQCGDRQHGDSDPTPMVRESWLAGMDSLLPESDLPTGGGGMLEVRRATHEAAHQLAFNSGLQKRGAMYPLWVSEGLATNFEADSLRAVGIARDNSPRQRQLLAARDAARLMPLESFVKLVRVPNGGPEIANDLYAEAWALFNFLFKTRPAELRAYLNHLNTLETGPRSPEALYHEFTSAFGSMGAVERSWLDYMDALQERGRSG